MQQLMALLQSGSHWVQPIFEQTRIMIIGFNKHVDFYDRVPSCTVIARSEATWGARERRLWPSSDRRQRRRQGSEEGGQPLGFAQAKRGAKP